MVSNIPIVDLLPTVPKGPSSIFDILKPPEQSVFALLQKMAELQSMQNAFKQGIVSEKDSGLGYEGYLQVGHPDIKALATSIVQATDTNDQKVFKLEQWVQNNITYKSDISNYGVGELWAYPLQTIKKGSGDCEDGAFLLHSLAIAAGVPQDKLRTYGGMVFDPSNPAVPGGHAWVAYKRATDDEWIPLDWCYWAKHNPIADRQALSYDLKYIDDFWYITEGKTVATPIANKVRYATKGLFVNKTV